MQFLNQREFLCTRDLTRTTTFEGAESLGFSAGSLAVNSASYLIYDPDTNENRRYNLLALTHQVVGPGD